ncbi:MAG: 4Fe-4S dicluster domain-containing protein [Firmicutes bacterium]|nr:4Fe-4S dicluster domain-containing protein [Bacillota bacterium]
MKNIEISGVRAIYFSPTGSTKTITEYVAKGLAELFGVPMRSTSYTLPGERARALASMELSHREDGEERLQSTAKPLQNVPGVFAPGELVVWGTPTYAGRIPNKTLDFVREILTTRAKLENASNIGKAVNAESDKAAGGIEASPNAGSDKSIAGNLMIPIAVYGNRSFDNCLAELGGLMKKGGHLPVAGIAMPTRHTFSKTLGAGRPDSADFKALDDFCVKIKHKLMDMAVAPVAFPGEEEPERYYVPKRLDGEPAVFLKAKPQLHPEKCTGCGACAAVCPMGSITFADSKASSGDDNAGISVDKEIQRSSEIIANMPEFPGICIKCQACIQHCQNGALYFDDADFLSHVAMLEANFAKEHKEPQLFL